MKKTWLLLLAASLPLAVSAQIQNTGAANADGQGAQEREWMKSLTQDLQAAIDRKDVAAITQITFNYTKHVTQGMNVCGQVIDDATIFGAVASNEAHELAMAIRWFDLPSSSLRSAVFTARKRCIAVDGTTVDGKWIVKLLPNSLALSGSHALVAFEAQYWNSLVEARPGVAPHRGVFIEDRFLVELDPAKASPVGKWEPDEKDRDFHWTDDPEAVTIKPGLALVPAAPAVRVQTAKAATPCPAPPKTPSFLDKLKQKAERSLEQQAKKADASIGKATGGMLDGGVKDAASSAIAEANSSVCPPAKGPGK